MDFTLLLFIFLLSQQVRLIYQQNSAMFVRHRALKRDVNTSSSRLLLCARQCAYSSCCVQFTSAKEKSCQIFGRQNPNITSPSATTPNNTVYNRVSKSVLFWAFHWDVQSDPRKMLGGSGKDFSVFLSRVRCASRVSVPSSPMCSNMSW